MTRDLKFLQKFCQYLLSINKSKQKELYIINVVKLLVISIKALRCVYKDEYAFFLKSTTLFFRRQAGGTSCDVMKNLTNVGILALKTGVFVDNSGMTDII